MKTIITYFTQTIFLVIIINSCFGQTNCSEDKVIGGWTYINSFRYRESQNIDSIIKVSEKSGQAIGTWTFKSDGAYTMTIDTIRKSNSKGHFKIIEDKCEIRLGRKKETPEGLIFHILFLDDKYLIMKCTKPKGDFLYVYRRR